MKSIVYPEIPDDFINLGLTCDDSGNFLYWLIATIENEDLLNLDQARTWAFERNLDLPSGREFYLIESNGRGLCKSCWYWTNNDLGPSIGLSHNSKYGSQLVQSSSMKLRALGVKRIPVIAAE